MAAIIVNLASQNIVRSATWTALCRKDLTGSTSNIERVKKRNRTACPATAGRPPAEFDPMKPRRGLRE